MSRAIVGIVFVCAVVLVLAYATVTDEALVAVNEVATSTVVVAPTSSTQRVVKRVTAVASSTVNTIKEIAQPPESGWKRAIATVFWVGEDATEDNEFIHNSSSAWDVDWEEHFGGVDDPDERCGFEPCDFEPEENPFYIALPYNDLARGKRKENAEQIPWNDPNSRKSVLKNRWIEVRAGGKSCFGQWQDVGPFGEDDIEYVFGDARQPKNTTGQEAGIDLSPAMRDCLDIGDVANVEWRHVEDEAVPDGPWMETITTRR